jgi:hypothetical protein
MNYSSWQLNGQKYLHELISGEKNGSMAKITPKRVDLFKNKF